MMNALEMSRYIPETFEGVDMVVNAENVFFFYNPDPTVPPDHMFPWATLMVNDVNDPFSNLERPEIYRLNIGVSKATFQSLFGTEKQAASMKDTVQGEPVFSGYDYTALDQVMPHPVYGKMYWVCVLNPGEATFDKAVRPLLDEAYAMAREKYSKRR
jgi:hypothetical protein